MRFSVTYKANFLPIDYRMKVYSLIKEAIKNEDRNLYSHLFTNQNRKMKPFSFAVYLKNYKLEMNRILLEELTITISSNLDIAVHLFNGLKKMKSYQISGDEWKQTNIKIINEKKIDSDTVYMKTLSPILVENRNGQPLSPKDDQYEAELNYFANLKIMQEESRNLYRPIKFTPIKMKKTVIKESNRDFKNTYKDSTLFYTTYSGIFQLEGHPQDLQILYRLGLGKRTTYFGLLEYVQ